MVGTSYFGNRAKCSLHLIKKKNQTTIAMLKKTEIDSLAVFKTIFRIFCFNISDINDFVPFNKMYATASLHQVISQTEQVLKNVGAILVEVALTYRC